MLFLSLPFALVLFAAAHAAARPDPQPVGWGRFLLGGGAVVAPFCMGIVSPLIAGLFLLLGACLLVWPYARRRVPTFLPLSVMTVVIAYGSAGWYAWSEQAGLNRLRQNYPFESLADRVSEPRSDLRKPVAGDAEAFGHFERGVGDVDRLNTRQFELRRLHESTVHTFVNSPGFGVARMMPPPTEKSLSERPDRGVAPTQPGSPAIWGHAEPFVTPAEAERKAFDAMHVGGVIDFAYPGGWGYVKSRTEVAGFLSHRFSKVPEVETWQVRRIELVGLLKHPEPVVYLSDKLPAMDQLRAAPTRPADAFEAAGLAAVRKGDDGFAGRRGDVVRFVGAIRSARQCVECHGGERGDLLGAFSYVLRASGARP